MPRVGEQHMRAWAIDASRLKRVVGGGNSKLLSKLRRPIVDEVREMVERSDIITLQTLVDEVTGNALVATNAYRYRRTCELVLEAIGTSLAPPIKVMPGKGWQALGPALRHWKLPLTARLWERIDPWPWKAHRTTREVAWPLLRIVHRVELGPVIREVAAFDADTIVRLGVPRTVPRFGEGEWPMDALQAEFEHLLGVWSTWFAAANRKKRDLAIWHDGQS
jgi:hypothetical protein